MDLFELFPSCLFPVAALAGVAVVATRRYHDCERRGRASWAAIATPRDVTLVFRNEHPTERCPTAEELRDKGYIDPASKLTDAWDVPFFIDCLGDDVRVSSAGRDGKLGSMDDVVVPIAARRTELAAP
jgi:hypothetical protein